MKTRIRLTEPVIALALLAGINTASPNRLSFFSAAHAQSAPGATVVTHHETVPNPVFGSDFQVTARCKRASRLCNWDDTRTWTEGRIPNNRTNVIIDGNVQIRNRAAVARSIGIYPGGKLSFSARSKTRLLTNDIVVFNGGALEVGTASTPIRRSRFAEIIFRDSAFTGADGEQHLRGLLALGGTIRIHGRNLRRPYIRSNREPLSGDTAVTLSQSAKKAGWRVGDNVLIPTSQQCARASTSCNEESEDRRITAISTDGRTLSLNQPLVNDHPGARNHSGSLDYTPHIINKQRNVIFKSENPNGVRGHMLFHGRADIDMRYAEVRDMGRTNIENLGDSNRKGRYPIHTHHLIGPVTAQDNGAQFTLIGNVVDFGTENYAQNRKWGIAIHGSHFGLIEGNVVDYASGAGIVTESGEEMGNTFRRNFVVRVIGGNGARTEDTDPSDGSKLGRAGVGYWFNGGGRNFFEQNVAASIAECVYCYGFKFDNVRNGDLQFPWSQGSDPAMEGGEIVSAHTIGLNNFTDNEAYAVPNGLTIWWECTFGDLTPDDDCSSLVDTFNLWHHHRWGFHGYPVNNLTLSTFIVRGDKSVLSNRFENVTGMEFGDYMHRNLSIVNADIQNVQTGIQMSSMRHDRGTTGPRVGINTIKDSFVVATEGVGIWAPASVNGASDLSPQTTIIENVRFRYPDVDLTGQEVAHIRMHDASLVLDESKANYTLRNDVFIRDYNRAPGSNGPDLYVIPGYHGPSRCDNRIGICNNEQTAKSRYRHIKLGHVYRLR